MAVESSGNKIIIFLLGAILAVLLFGKEAVINFASLIPWIILAGLVGLFVLALFREIIRNFWEESVAELEKQVASGRKLVAISCIVAYFCFIGNIIVVFIGAYNALDQHISFQSGLKQVPFYGLPIIAFMICMAPTFIYSVSDELKKPPEDRIWYEPEKPKLTRGKKILYITFLGLIGLVILCVVIFES